MGKHIYKKKNVKLKLEPHIRRHFILNLSITQNCFYRASEAVCNIQQRVAGLYLLEPLTERLPHVFFKALY